MAKQILLLILLTAVAIIFKAQVDDVLNFMVSIHDHFINMLSAIFSSDGVGRVIQAILGMLLIPAIIALIVSTLYWFRKKNFCSIYYAYRLD